MIGIFKLVEVVGTVNAVNVGGVASKLAQELPTESAGGVYPVKVAMPLVTCNIVLIAEVTQASQSA